VGFGFVVNAKNSCLALARRRDLRAWGALLALNPDICIIAPHPSSPSPSVALLCYGHGRLLASSRTVAMAVLSCYLAHDLAWPPSPRLCDGMHVPVDPSSPRSGSCIYPRIITTTRGTYCQHPRHLIRQAKVFTPHV
jgi:hypothetical protein